MPYCKIEKRFFGCDIACSWISDPVPFASKNRVDNICINLCRAETNDCCSMQSITINIDKQ